MREPRILILGSETEINDTLVADLGSEGYHVEVARRGAEAVAAIAGAGVELAILDLSAQPVDSYIVCKALRALPQDSRPAVILLVDDAQKDDAREILADGRVATLAKPVSVGQLAVVLQGLLSANLPPGETSDRTDDTGKNDHGRSGEGIIAAVYGAKGGIGKTFVAINTAGALARVANSRVAIMDGDLQFGEIAARLRLPSDRNLRSLTTSSKELSWAQLKSIVVAHRSGLDAILAPPQPWLAEYISGEVLVEALRVLRNRYPYVVVDTHTSYDPKTLLIIEQADVILLVTTQDQFARRSALSFMAVAKRLGYVGKVRVVINMMHGQQQQCVKSLENEFRSRLIGTIRMDPAAAVALERGGSPLLGLNNAGSDLAAQDLEMLAGSLSRTVMARHAIQGRK